MPVYFKNSDVQETEEITIHPVLEAAAQPELKLSLPNFNIILHYDRQHSYDYIVEMLSNIFGYSPATAFEMCCKLDISGRLVVFTGNRDQAELKKHQITNYGPDWRIPGCNDSMKATLEIAHPVVDFSVN